MNWPWKKTDPKGLLEEALRLLEGKDPTSQPVIQKLKDLSNKLTNHAAANAKAAAAINAAIKLLETSNSAGQNKPSAIALAKINLQGGINSIITGEIVKSTDDFLKNVTKKLK
jgi:hypothetical protein